MRALLIVATLALNASALAQPGSGEPGGGPRAADFAKLDRNGDSYVTRGEARVDRGNPQALRRSSTPTRIASFRSPNIWRRAKTWTSARSKTPRSPRACAAALIAERGIPWTGISVETYEGRCSFRASFPRPTWRRAPDASDRERERRAHRRTTTCWSSKNSESRCSKLGAHAGTARMEFVCSISPACSPGPGRGRTSPTSAPK